MRELFAQAGWAAIPLLFCSVLCLGIVLERLFTLPRIRKLEDRAFAVLLDAARRGDDPAEPPDSEIAAAPVAAVLAAVAPLRGEEADAAAQAAEVALALQRLRLRRYLGTLATIGSTAPFIGLFGTVLGIMGAFQGMSRTGLSGETMAAGISEALSATALGLLVAVPSVVAYNYFTGRVQVLLLHIQGHVARLMPTLRRAAAPPGPREAASAPREAVLR